jgi:hypothetical protein
MWESHDLADAASLALHFPGRNNEETITAKIKHLYAPANMSRQHGKLRRLAKLTRLTFCECRQESLSKNFV